MSNEIITRKEFAELCKQYGITLYGTSRFPRTREKAIKYLEMIKKSFEVEEWN